MIIIVRLLSPEPVGWFCHHQLYSGVGADIVMESISLIDGVMSAMGLITSTIANVNYTFAFNYAKGL
jgi:hypothetical protein